MAGQTKTKPEEAPEVDAAAVHAQLLEMHAEATQLLTDARAEAARIVEAAAAAGTPEGGTVSIEALAAALRGVQAPAVTVEMPKVELPPRADDVEEGFRPVLFRSRDRSHLVVRVPRHRHTASNGEVQTSDGRNYSFEPTGDLTVHNSDVADFLRGRPGFNRFYFEVGKEPHSQAAMEPVLDAIQQAILDMDDAALEELEIKEMASLKRSLVLNQLRKARERVQKQGDAALSEVLG